MLGRRASHCCTGLASATRKLASITAGREQVLWCARGVSVGESAAWVGNLEAAAVNAERYWEPIEGAQ